MKNEKALQSCNHCKHDAIKAPPLPSLLLMSPSAADQQVNGSGDGGFVFEAKMQCGAAHAMLKGFLLAISKACPCSLRRVAASYCGAGATISFKKYVTDSKEKLSHTKRASKAAACLLDGSI